MNYPVIYQTPDYQTTNNKNMNLQLRKLLSPSLRKQIKAHLRENNLELTNKGQAELLEILSIEKEKELTERAEEIIEENKQ